MRHLAIGDIHGAFRSLVRLAEFVPFRADDLLITLGDYVDKGPNSHEVLDWLIAWSRRGRLIPLYGNHEMQMLRARDSEKSLDEWLAAGGDATLASYSHFGDRGRLVDVPDAHWEFIEQKTRGWYEIDTHFFVHAGAFHALPLAEQPEYKLLWEKIQNPLPHISGKIMVHGHTPQRSGVPRNWGHAVCIDTAAWENGWLTCLDVATHRIWQTNEAGEARTGWLEDPPKRAVGGRK